MNVPVHIIKAWGKLGLITNKGAGGTGNVALWDYTELHTAPDRRVRLRARGTCSRIDCDEPHWGKGLCHWHYRRWRAEAGLGTKSAPTTPTQNGEATLRRGGALHPPAGLPYRALAVSCPECGALRTTPDHLLRKDAGRLPSCPRCRVMRVTRNKKRRREVDDDFRREERRRSDRNVKRANDVTAASARNWNKQWTGPELEIAARDDLSARQVALMLGRTLYAVKHMRRQLRIDPRKINLAAVSPGSSQRVGVAPR
jgi:hypothetical protein